MNFGRHLRILFFGFFSLGLLPESLGQKAVLDKYEAYYQQNAASIDSLIGRFEVVYAQRPCSMGFTDLSFRHFSLEVYSDSVRYIFNSAYSAGFELDKAVGFHYDTGQLSVIAQSLTRLKCLWIGKASFYKNGQKEWVTFLSFRQVNKGKLFAPEQYLVLLVPKNKGGVFAGSKKLQSGALRQVGENAFLTVGNGFR